MFPRSSRFPAAKPSEVPGPGTYNPQEPQAHYKHGAFIEKADRFDEEKPSDVPGPGTYVTDKNAKPVKKGTAPSSQADRYAVLQKKLEDLERVHLEGKKAHQTELERLKQELSRALKSCTEQTDHLAKAKKQNDVLDARVQELKKTSAAEQAELKDLRVKFRLLEHERTQLVAKQGEAGETKKALMDLNARRRDELRERDRHIAELEKSAAVEKRRRESAETRLAEVNGKVDGKAAEAKDVKAHLEAKVAEAMKDAENARNALAVAEEGFEEREGDLLVQLESVRSMLQYTAEEYGRIAASSIPAAHHTLVKRELAVSKIANLRLGRKLANTEEQVHELAYLIRQIREENCLFSAQLREAADESLFFAQALRDAHRYLPPPPVTDNDLRAELASLCSDALELQLSDRSTADELTHGIDEIRRLTSRQVVFAYSILDRDLRTCQSQLQQSADELKAANLARSNLNSQLQSLQAAHEFTQRQLAETIARAEEARAEANLAKQQVDAAESRLRDETATHAQMLQKEMEATRKMAATVQKNKAAEDVLQVEIEQLTADLMDAIAYQEAFTDLKEEVGALVARNALAEEEAEKLSRFNAEIVGHHNPSQRILYVDRIRRELAETKQTLLLAMRDQEAAHADADDLRHELELYKSVAVPPSAKSRTGMTRVGRIPLVNQSLNGKPSGSAAAMTKIVGAGSKDLTMLMSRSTFPET